MYYKVKAKKSKKTISTSKPVRVERRLKPPKVYMTKDRNVEVPTFNLTWDAVAGAVKYNIYVIDYDKGKKIKLKTVTDTYWKYVNDKDYNYIDYFVTAQGSRKNSESYPAQISFTPW